MVKKGKSKKPFIDKKTATTYHLVRRSQRDVGGYSDEDDEGNSEREPNRDFVLVAAPGSAVSIDPDRNTNANTRSDADTNADDALDHARRALGSVGLIDDYDIDRHTRPIDGSGEYFDRSGKRVSAVITSRKPAHDLLAGNVREVDRKLDAITLTDQCMDEDVAQVLMGDYEEGDFEEILDDFCITANMDEPTEEDLKGYYKTEEEFDFNKHVDTLIARAKESEMRARGTGGAVVPEGHEWWESHRKDFQGKKHLRRVREEDDDNDHDDAEICSLDEEFDNEFGEVSNMRGIVPKLGKDEEKALCERFNQTLAQYDSDEVGDLDDECEDIRGDVPLEGNARLEATFDKFLEEKNDGIFVEGTAHLPDHKKCGGSGFKVLDRQRMISVHLTSEGVLEGNEDEVIKLDEILAEADQVLANPEMDLPPEEVLIDGKSYFTQSVANRWDCDSILSTYSNLDNNPAVIGRSRHRSMKKKDWNQSTSSQSKKSGEGESHYNDEDDQDTLSSSIYGVGASSIARSKNETKEGKKARKLAVKQSNRLARIQKKVTREAFQDEFDRRARHNTDNNLEGKTVFRLS